ncbi:thiamine pyrophosphate-binding protein [Frankia nepalensis]|uniref:Thiamine pyrophosphate enzyme N-terminal TPP-binding domain-containing protein n=1 Tax=Frankia nepalensis TaxID=1836974 RepID=A0A937RDE6_9ACTN|nr:thiamine pyrophosphate-binding protein [Frankia nepalensis]MBL7630063.1 hypothetical protein [Frankia nepalensis]
MPGDFAFAVQDAIVRHPGLEWIGCRNELNTGYAADGYARVRGIGALSTTYGVGELSAINAVAGSYAENLPVFHLTGMPAMPTQRARAKVHHTLGNGEFELFSHMAGPVVCAAAVMTRGTSHTRLPGGSTTASALSTEPDTAARDPGTVVLPTDRGGSPPGRTMVRKRLPSRRPRAPGPERGPA